MAFRHIVIRNPSKLSTCDEQLLIKQEETVRIPLEDICTITIEDPAITITAALLSKCVEYHVELIVCDRKRLPAGILQPFHRHSRQKAVLDVQLGLGKPFKKRIWQQIVIRKLENQARCLELANKGEDAQKLYSISKSVESGDRTNREAYGAKVYFTALFGPNFYRREDDVRNISLNYGYSLVRSLTARALVRYGFNPSLGIFHDSQTNAFNLADDFMEVLRPFVDIIVALNVSDETEWDSKMREKLFSVLNIEAVWKEERQSITNGVEQMIKSYVSACRQNDASLLLLPELIALRQHTYE
ncbi:type II CRISPR-associated endonuclease Cas1 [Bacillus cytotoxicus]|uniref:type II CRISPR-associated endonuclease Cas1 n=1 Tax=Bacillus cytotoxicus TaxID=580165 RepID=UPI0008645ACC|nr:type II CRISPR-associated endonuclease Cas1 [Bacillus cytotoxicus]AWC28795.1 type II CRISPR-associated endonuclease Cas1 [Bacillus cytotoxicus]AWC39822.1 type II CRISPR-associated endonuclease Cas1 [Bacillus cytotoxicus]AWC47753.1 type II CRISPR-associated endonuclease Cas1 [Bacillus cytotoxicus]AWC52862.1 type II CRISPR-associated endonuclease Cas1 [Bacillus cytotoxicus]AWC56994.1 type II CRISPR-associated endonuclease Cas1 [Bacillus cytotoxicus]